MAPRDVLLMFAVLVVVLPAAWALQEWDQNRGERGVLVALPDFRPL